MKVGDISPPLPTYFSEHLLTVGAAQSLIPVVMSGIIAVYALVVAVLIAGNMKPPPEKTYSLFEGCMHLACGLSVGLTGVAAGYAIGKVGDTVSRKLSDTECVVAGGLTMRSSGRASIHATVADIRWNGVDFDLWRGAGTLRVSRYCVGKVGTKTMLTLTQIDRGTDLEYKSFGLVD